MTPLSDQSYSQWTRRPDDPHWCWEIRFNNNLEGPPDKSGFGEGPGLCVLDDVVRELADLLYKSPEEPNAVTLILEGVAF